MIIKEITVGKSVQVLVLGSEQWIKMSATAEISEGENENEAVDELFKFVDEHLKCRIPEQSFVPGAPNGDLYFNVSKQKEERR